MIFGVDDVVIAVIAGAVIGSYTGGVMANDGQYNPLKWDWKSQDTYFYMLAGAIVGGGSSYLGASIAMSGIPFANTASIMASSFVNSLGMHVYTFGKTPISMSFGVASYDFTNGEWGYLGKKGNTTMQNIGYAFGAMALSSDLVSYVKGNGKRIEVNSADTSHDWWGHSSITEDGHTLVSVGPSSPVGKDESVLTTIKNSIKNACEWKSYYGEDGTWTIGLNNISVNAINEYVDNITRWDLLFNSCVGHTTRALWAAGVPVLYLFHPHMLNFQLLIRQLGIYASPFIYQAYTKSL